MRTKFDVIVIGAGAAGMMCAARANNRNLSVLLLDHASKIGEKIRVSGGGRCNFSNLDVSPNNYISNQPNFCQHALKHFSVQDFLKLLQKHKISWHQKHKGQLFCDHSAQDIINMLRAECLKVTWHYPFKIKQVTSTDDPNAGFCIQGEDGSTGVSTTYSAKQLVVATGGLALPAVGATDFGMRLAQQFGHKLVNPVPALVPLLFQDWQYAELAGLSLPVHIGIAGAKKNVTSFEEDLLFTHRGLSGPAILQISSFWHSGVKLQINLQPSMDLRLQLLERAEYAKQQLKTVVGEFLPKRLAQQWLHIYTDNLAERKIAEISHKVLRNLADNLHAWQVQPSQSAGYKKAEVMRGGVDTSQLNPKTMASKIQPNLYFIGEVVDVTGWLGGYNFQWAWSSAVLCADSLRA